MLPRLGKHIGKGPTFKESLMWEYLRDGAHRGIPSQIFVGNPKGWKPSNLQREDELFTKAMVEQNNLDIFVHGPYIINLAWEPQRFNTFPLERIKSDLDIASRLSFQGVVVHCGKSCKIKKAQALENMKTNTRTVLQYATERCPLILETSSGQGTELCWKYDEFRDFYLSFTEEERTRFKVCIDTCHVWAAGFEPVEFLQRWKEDVSSESISLIHYNDSKLGLGCKLDRHEVPGQGEIGEERMQEIMVWCILENLPMIIE